MEEELAFYVGLNRLVSERLIQDLRDERFKGKPEEDKAGIKKKVLKERHQKESKLKAVTLAAAPPSYESESESTDDMDLSQGEEDVNDDDRVDLQFSRIHVPTKVSTEMSKGKNKFQKLREAAYREKQESEDPIGSTWAKVKAAAAGENVEPSYDQLKKSMKKEKQQKRKKFEKRQGKGAKEQKNWSKQKKRSKRRI
jgi:hypothetical protein